ncbi:MAG: hypothetical protein K6G81_05045 [Lachnospiraceae bacterium]|nr:hypothetical protein [Lachnospiraceae bacterium]
MDEKKSTGARLSDEALDKVAGGMNSYEYDKMTVGDLNCPKCGEDTDIDGAGYGPDNTRVMYCMKCKEFWLAKL